MRVSVSKIFVFCSVNCDYCCYALQVNLFKTVSRIYFRGEGEGLQDAENETPKAAMGKGMWQGEYPQTKYLLVMAMNLCLFACLNLSIADD